MVFKRFILFLIVTMIGTSTLAQGQEIEPKIVSKILSAGVPKAPLLHLLKFRQRNMGKTFVVDTSICLNGTEEKPSHCGKNERIPSTRNVTIIGHKYLAIVDFTKNSLARRLFVIDTETGTVETHQVTHGEGSGFLFARKFSNLHGSKQSSLGIYLTDETYDGSFGYSLKLHGLEQSNDQAYPRNVVFHGAWYAAATFPNTINPVTGLPYGRLGLSQGCLAVDNLVAAALIEKLKGGALIYNSRSSTLNTY